MSDKGINGSTVTAIGIGTIHIKCGKGRQLTLKDVLYIPDIKLWPISVGCLSDGGLQTSFTATTCTIWRGSKVITGSICHGKRLYTLTEQVSVEHIHIVRPIAGIDIWHWWLGHVHYAAFNRMAEKQLAKGMPTNQLGSGWLTIDWQPENEIKNKNKNKKRNKMRKKKV